MIYRNILVPVDGSETADLGLREAVRLAKDQGRRIRLVHVVNELVLLSPNAYGMDLGSIFRMLVMGGEELLDRAEAEVRRAGIEVDAVLFEAMGGQAGVHIVRKALEWRADLIVCGTHGRRGLRRMVLGSDAEFVVRHSPVPVLLVRGPGPNTEEVSRHE